MPLIDQPSGRLQAGVLQVVAKHADTLREHAPAFVNDVANVLAGECANIATTNGAIYLTSRGAAVFLGLGEESDGSPTVGSLYRLDGQVVELTTKVGTQGLLAPRGKNEPGQWVDLARLGTDIELMRWADPLGRAIERLVQMRSQGRGPRYFKPHKHKGSPVFYRVADLVSWMEDSEAEIRRAG